ncbi:hypothetical protein FPSE_09575 [Fusarium pseudograminearum CS3096]|uniref:DUF6546 domain-containing protein n=1 Tax=Fusarium pseudograminearum (strain CS3096) TaxID=1028729 RepID=K3VD63_FUSPC|nr:hypothetical protein FPSE_09575 [Fusarium pseudograminearum CS3096]EKJ70358.1 hypothetical protein FPSE_09575 [Fusarium pseudograminearum CS3096]
MSRPNLPLDIQLNILGYLLSMGEHEDSIEKSILATVSKPWQDAIERKLFRSLTVNLLDLKDFCVYTKDRTHLVKHILLELNLCKLDRGPTISRNCFQAATWILFGILSTWHNRDITLEIGILPCIERRDKCPKTNHIHPMGSVPRCRSPDTVFKEIFELPSEMLFGGVLAESEPAWHNKASSLLGRMDLGFQPSMECYIPSVKCISKLLIRRRYFPNISSLTLARIMLALPSLESVHIERWCYGDLLLDTLYDMKFRAFFRVPRSCKNISFYEESDTAYHRRVTRPRESQPNTTLRESLVEEAGHLENIAVSFSFDAVSFFTPPFTSDFKELKTLALTSPTMVSKEYGVVDDFLCATAKVAKGMPKLETLELWYFSSPSFMPPHPTPSCAGIFTYQRLDRYSSCISWKSTRSFKMSEETRESWKGVVDVEGAEFSVEHLDLDPDQLTSIGKLYPYLALRDRILHGITWTEA